MNDKPDQDKRLSIVKQNNYIDTTTNLKSAITTNASDRKSVINRIFTKKRNTTFKENEILNATTTTPLNNNRNDGGFVPLYMVQLVKPLFVEIEKEKNIKKKVKTKTIFNYIVENNYFVAFMTVLTIIALFANDIQMAWLPPGADLTYDIVQTIMFVLFCLEIIFTSLAKRTYIFSFFFWLDIVATLSLIQDITFIFNPLINLAYGYYLLI